MIWTATRACKDCGGQMPAFVRYDCVYCSNKCRQAAYRKRKAALAAQARRRRKAKQRTSQKARKT